MMVAEGILLEGVYLTLTFPIVCLLSGGIGGATEPTASCPAAKMPFLTITEKIAP